MSFLKTAAEIWRDYVTDGVPASGAHEIPKADMRAWGATVEAGIANINPRFAWDTGTADADPGAGKVRADNASLASATMLFISEEDASGADLAAWLATLDDSTNTVKGTVILRDMADVTNFAVFQLTALTDAGDYVKLTVTYVTHGGAFAADADLGLQFQRAGDAASVGGALGSTDNVVPRTDGTGGATLQASPLVISDAGAATGLSSLDATVLKQNGVAVWSTVMKVADETIQSNTTLFADAALKFAMLANTKYAIRARILFSTGATGDFKWRHVGPASPTGVSLKRAHIVGAGTAYAGIALDGSYSGSDIAVAGAAGIGWVEFDAIVHNGANAGNFEFWWAQNASEAVNTTVRGGSYIDYRVVA